MRKKNLRLVGLLSVLLVLASACGTAAKVGNENLLDVDEKEGQEALGRSKSPSPEPSTDTGKAALGDKPTPTPSPSPPPDKFFEIWLIADFPYYADGQTGKGADSFSIPSGFKIRITSKDDTTDSGGRKRERQPAAADGSFLAPAMKFGEVYTLPALGPGTYELRDNKITFITNGKIEVR